MVRPKPLRPKGLVEKHKSLQHFDLTMVEPSPALSGVVANYWTVKWDMKNAQSYSQLNLPHPSQHLVVDPQIQSGVFGVTSGAFSYHMQGKGKVFGVKFVAGQFRRFATHSMAKLTDSFVPIKSYFNVEDQEVVDAFQNSKKVAEFANVIEQMLLAHETVDDDKAELARNGVAYIEQNREVLEVSVVANHFGISPRTLQRIFAEYVGVGPKWVIERYRMIEAIEQLNEDTPVLLTELAHSLGYFDQAHFSRAFKMLTGRTPSELAIKSD